MLPPTGIKCKYCDESFITFAQSAISIKLLLRRSLEEHYKKCKVKNREDRFKNLLDED